MLVGNFSITRGDDWQGMHVVCLAGELDLATSTGLADELCDIAQSTLIADLSALRFIDGSGITQFIRAKETIEATGNHLVIRGANPMVRRVFDILGLSDMLRGSDDLQTTSSLRTDA